MTILVWDIKVNHTLVQCTLIYPGLTTDRYHI